MEKEGRDHRIHLLILLNKLVWLSLAVLHTQMMTYVELLQ